MERSLLAIAAVAGLALLAGTALAQTKSSQQNYPVRPIRIIVTTTAGSATDFTARAIGQRLTEAWGQQAVVDDRPGAGGVIGHELAAKASPDGYTLVLSSSAGLVINPLLYKVPYDRDRDFAPISLAVINPNMLVSHPALPVRSVDQLVALARAKPGQLNCASPGTGTANHLGCELLKSMTVVDFVHVPYKGTSPAITDLVGGQVDFMFNSMPAVLPLARAGKLRALATAGRKRSAATPDLPTIAETIPGYECINWYALLAPRGTPPAIVARLNAEVVKMFADPSFAQRFADQGSEPQTSTPAELAAYMRSESERWARVIKLAGLRTEH
jgi:tripartite-type tricarboxylate transporter receptor subunit TctC